MINKKTKNYINFTFNSDGVTLFATFEYSENKLEKLTVEYIHQRLEQLKLNDLFIDEQLVFEFINRCRHATENFMLKIGERRDATCGITISEDKLRAYLTLTKNFGGKAIELENIQKLLLIKKIVFGVVPLKEIEDVLNNGHVTDFLIANGIEPIAGVDTQFKDLTPKRHERKPLIDDKGNVDFRELGDIVIVHENEVLMQRIPPIPGKKGMNVFGHEIEPTEGLDIPFSKELFGVFINSADENQLLSSITGQPILLPDGIIVSPILTVDNINLASGNVRFDGSIVVLGNVDANMKVYALDDITIGGDVINAKIECKGNLKINGGIIGDSEIIAGGDIQIKGGVQKYSHKVNKKINSKITTNKHRHKIITRGCIYADFIENCCVEAGIDIVINKYALNSELLATNKIVIGTGGGGYDQQSSIVGGIAWAMLLIKVVKIGASSGVKTQIQVGSNPYIQRKLKEIKQALLKVNTEKEKIDILIDWMIKNPNRTDDGTLINLKHTKSRLALESDTYLEELNELKSHVEIINTARIITERGLYAGAELKINKSLLVIHEDYHRRRTFQECVEG
jgi:uncharacterized protein (DUF342 family)